jgi:ankyrin repeat protein
MDSLSEGEMRAQDAQCPVHASASSRTAVVKLKALPAAGQALCIARYAQLNLPHLVRCALDAGITADTRLGEDDTPVLCIAAEQGSARSLKALLDGRANLALADKEGMTAAHKAAFYSHAPCLRLLLAAGAPKEAKTSQGFMPLHVAAQEGHAECCSMLIASGCAGERARRHEARVQLTDSPLSGCSERTAEHAALRCLAEGAPGCDLPAAGRRRAAGG